MQEKENQIDRLSFFGRKKGNEQKTDRHVCGFIPYGAFGRGKDPAVYILLAVVAVSVFLSDRKVLGQVDYCLIFTFIAFFIFTGNIGRLPAFQEVLHSLVNGRELLVGIATSQVISNVPAALLLSGFSGDLKQLLLGVNLGGLGTLIASMASLISYKIYAHNYNRTKGYYLLWFHLANIIFLAVLVLLALGMR